MSEKKEKIAFIFDTNFIFQNQNHLDRVLGQLSEEYVVYVSQLSIEERIAQQCREQKVKFDKFQELQAEYKHIATMKLSTTYDERAQKIRRRVQAKYNQLFAERIIPLLKNEATYSEVLERALMKKPPFLSEEKVDGKSGGKSPSDKGFKDAVMWVSILQFFKDHGEQTVLFLTEDKGFRNQASVLCKEFAETTGKQIEIKDNAYFKELTKVDTTPAEDTTPILSDPIPDIYQLRERIRATITAVCGFYSEGYWGEEEWLKYFTVNKLYTASDMEIVFSGLDAVLAKNLFEQEIHPDDIFGVGPFVVTCNYQIPTRELENVAILYREMQKKWPQHIDQFYETTAKIVNGNYVAPPVIPDSVDFELPF